MTCLPLSLNKQELYLLIFIYMNKLYFFSEGHGVHLCFFTMNQNNNKL